VVGLASDLSTSTLDDLARRHGLTHVEAQPIALIGTTYHRWRIGDGRSVSDVIRALEADGVVRTAQPNYRFAGGIVAKHRPRFTAQYASGKLHLAEAHRIATDRGVIVAVIGPVRRPTPAGGDQRLEGLWRCWCRSPDRTYPGRARVLVPSFNDGLHLGACGLGHHGVSRSRPRGDPTTSSHGVPASSEARIVGYHSISNRRVARD
jgi:hypothetical protein